MHVSPLKILQDSAKKLGLRSTDVSLKKNGSKLLIQSSDKMYIARESSLFPDVSEWQKHFMNDKILSQNVLKKLSYKTVTSADIVVSQYKSEKVLLSTVTSLPLKYPVITKTNKGYHGFGIVFIENEKQLVAESRRLYREKKRFMIQPVLWHDEYRLTLIAKKIVMMHKKRLAWVDGDGTSTLDQLITAQRADLVDKNFIDWNMRQKNLTGKTVLSKGEFFETHIIKKRTTEYYINNKFPKLVSDWCKQITKDLSATTIGLDILAPKGLLHPEKFIVIEVNANPGYTYLIDELNDHITPYKICEHVLHSYFGNNKK